MKIPLIADLIYDNPYMSFLVNAIIVAFVVSVAFGINEYLDDRYKKYELKKRAGLKIIIHFTISFFSSLLVVTLLYVLFGIGSHYFPLCSYPINCKTK